MNYPGSWHDRKVVVASDLLNTRLSDEKTPRCYAILGDSAFVTNSRITNGKIIRSWKSPETADVPISDLLVQVDVVMQPVMPIKRQLAQ